MFLFPYLYTIMLKTHLRKKYTFWMIFRFLYYVSAFFPEAMSLKVGWKLRLNFKTLKNPS